MHETHINLMGNNINIRNINESDVEGIYNIYKKEGWGSFDKNLVEKLIVNSISKFIVVTEGEKIIGFSRYLSDNVLTVFLAEIIVEKEYRNIGVGKAMIREIFNQNEGQRIELITDNPKFYEKLEFRKVGSGYRKYDFESVLL